MVERVHRAQAFRTGLPGVEAFALRSDQPFPRHAHDGFGIGVIHSGAHRSWSGVGVVEAGPGDVITVNPGEIHDGNPVNGQARSWRMLYLDPSAIAVDDLRAGVEFTRPALRDRLLAVRFGKLFSAATAPVPDRPAVEEGVVRTVAHLLLRYGNRPLRTDRPPPVARALQRIDGWPERPPTLAELAGLCGVSRFQLLRGFVRTVGITPHAYGLQGRVRLARRYLRAGRCPAEAAALSGFADQSHLTRAFRRQFGATPARYRAAVA